MKSPYFTDEHDLFRKTVRQFVQDEVVPHIDAWEKEQLIPREVWKKMGDLGFLGIAYPEQYGGADADFFFSVALIEEIAKCGAGGFTGAVLVHSYMATAHIARAGSKELKEKYLASAIAGDKIGALAITEPDAGSDVAAIRAKAVRDGDHYVINGSKTFITNGYCADFIAVAAKTNPKAGTAGITLIIVDVDTPGFSARKLEKIGMHCSDTAELTFEDVRVPVSNIIGEENMGFYYIMESFQLERLVGSFMGVGACEHCMEVTLQYINERKAFGRTISKFQVIRHTIAQLAAELEAARQLAYYTAWLHDNGLHAVRECSYAKLITSELAKKMTDECLQFFGGYGYMDEYIISRMYRDARVGTIAAGTSEILKEIIAKITIDDMRYDAVYGKSGEEMEAKKKKAQEKGEGGKESEEEEEDASLLPKTAAEIIRGLPGRLRRDRAGDWETVMHFDITGPDGGRFTVKILGNDCTVEDGLQGEGKCLMETDDKTYADVELGRADPQAVFMSGRIKVSNLAEMMQFTKMFSRLFKKKK